MVRGEKDAVCLKQRQFRELQGHNIARSRGPEACDRLKRGQGPHSGSLFCQAQRFKLYLAVSALHSGLCLLVGDVQSELLECEMKI